MESEPGVASTNRTSRAMANNTDNQQLTQNLTKSENSTNMNQRGQMGPMIVMTYNNIYVFWERATSHFIPLITDNEYRCKCYGHNRL